ncbi:MAG: LCP family protein [Anaerolineae bacterium]
MSGQTSHVAAGWRLTAETQGAPRKAEKLCGPCASAVHHPAGPAPARPVALRGLGMAGVLLCALALLLAGCFGGSPAPTPMPESTVAAPTDTATAATPPATPPPTPTVTPSPSGTPTAVGPTATLPSVTLIRPSPAAPTATVEAWPTPIWPPSPLDQTNNILVMGMDQRPDEAAWRTDTIMVVAVDAPGNRVGIISVPRDLYVDIPGYGMGRINQADYLGETSGYPDGGPALLRRVLTETLGIPTQHYVRIRMEGLVKLVDALGGVTVVLDCPLYERTPNDASPNGVEDWTLPAGPVLLDGESARKFATYRYVSTDFGRARRQQQLIWAIRDRALQLDIIPRIPELWRALSEMFVTDLSLLDVLKLATFGINLRPENVHGTVLGDDVMEYYVTAEGAWVLTIADYDGIARKKAELFAERPLAALNIGSEAGGCPPPPTPVPTFTPAPTPEPTPSPASP